MTRPLISLAALLALAAPSFAQEATPAPPSPAEIVDQAPEDEWVVIPPEDLLVMTLAPAADGSERKVVIQLMPAPFSQDWVANIRTFARAGWFDDITVTSAEADASAMLSFGSTTILLQGITSDMVDAGDFVF